MVDERSEQTQSELERRSKAMHASIEENTSLTTAADARSARIEAVERAVRDF